MKTKEELIEKHLESTTELRGDAHHYTIEGKINGKLKDAIMSLMDEYSNQQNKDLDEWVDTLSETVNVLTDKLREASDIIDKLKKENGKET